MSREKSKGGGERKTQGLDRETHKGKGRNVKVRNRETQTDKQIIQADTQKHGQRFIYSVLTLKRKIL